MYYNLMKTSSENMNINFDKAHYEKFERYMRILQKWNEKINLTSIIEDKEIIQKHFIDSIKIFEFEEMENMEKIIDVGTGAGFPGIPIKIVKPEIKLTLLDSLNKRVKFLKEVGNELGLENIEYIHGRAEDFGNDNNYREQYDLATSRAVANMTVLSEYCLPFVKVGGYFIALKGPSVEDELRESEIALEKLGGRIKEIIEVDIEESDLKHNLVIVEKVSKTPANLPRRTVSIRKKPL
ncbi:MAG: 16S rRNA (guanine(527)-N(7))-methyltransferase RsmG [Clostridium sp.]|nr:16S rRNA (guanine(527)-N(7))-methyltransferase RsmG [Clostridium sp.]